MGSSLQSARHLLEQRPGLEAFTIHQEGAELHLAKAGESFVRLLPDPAAGGWRMEYFHNTGEWQVIDFAGTLEECLDYLVDAPHYRFWEG